MTIEELHDNATVVHKKYNRKYRIVNNHLLMKNPTTGEWVASVTYEPLYKNPEKLFCRELQSFLNEFDIIQK